MSDLKLAQMVAALKNSGGGDKGKDGGGEDDPPITNKIRQSWNDYIGWLREKGLAGSPKLDKGGLGIKMIEEYRKENPDTALTPDLVTSIQKDFSKYRQYALKQIDDGNAVLDTHNGVTRDNFLKALSVVDGIPGQRTTSYTFPKIYMKDMAKNEVKSQFANSNSTAQQQLANMQ